MKNKKKSIVLTGRLLVFLLLISPNCEVLAQNKNETINAFSYISKPYTRYWWFASEIQKEDVKYNLDWLKEHGFGGVELAWVYPLNRFNKNDTTITPRQEWLSPEWQKIVAYTMRYADSIGMGCDLTIRNTLAIWRQQGNF